MNTRREGFTLVEFLVVVVLGAIVLGAVYQSLIAQERTYRISGAMIQDQDVLRTSLGILETELREVGSLGGPDRGGSDILLAERDSVKFRAQRKVGVVCYPHPSDRWAYAAVIGEPFAANDTLILHVSQNDRWERAVVESVQSADASNCSGSPELVAMANNLVQRIKFANHTLSGVEVGSPFRSMELVTYGLYDFGDRGWGLGRHGANEPAQYVVGGLAGPGEGLRFEYLRTDGTVASDTSEIATMRITVGTRADGSGAQPAQVVSTLTLRN